MVKMEDTIRCRCAKCSKHFRVYPCQLGEVVECPHCKAPFRLQRPARDASPADVNRGRRIGASTGQDRATQKRAPARGYVAIAIVAAAIVAFGAGTWFVGRQKLVNLESYYPSGELQARWTAKRTPDGRDVRHGWYRRWHKNGQKAWEMRYEDGEWSTWDHWLQTGQRVMRYVNYDDGSATIKWHRNGQKQSEDIRRAGGLIYREWDEFGELVRDEVLAGAGESVGE